MTAGENPDRWTRARALFERAVDLPPAERDDFVARECAQDPELLSEVTGLLRADASPAGLLDRTLHAESLGLGQEPGSAPLAAGTTIGAWRLVRQLGAGGMGIVYLAERADATFAQRAALKVVRGGLASRALEERFLRERKILARLEHPGIARLLDGGLTPEGQPWFAMELVEGEPITDYAQHHALDVPARLRLFLDVCAAVQHAHRQLVIHRDLKPANILIDGDGRVRLLDFGVARLVDDTAEETGLTRIGLHALTPAYAAPEQIRGEPPTTATDVFGLGAILYELLAGKPIREPAGAAPTDLVRTLDREIPPLGSLRHLPPVQRRRLRGDLETIASAALAFEPERRYASVDALAADIERHLASVPVRARPASTAYRFGRYVRRHRVGVVASAVVLALLVAGVAGVLWQAQEARLEAARAREMSAFLQDLFTAVDPEEARGRVVTARELLDRGAERIGELKADPEVRVDVVRTLGELYFRLGLFDRSESLLRQAESEALAAFGADDPRTARVRASLGYTIADAGRYDEAARIAEIAIAASRKSGDEEALLYGLDTLGHVRYLQGRHAEGRDLGLEMLPLAERVLGPNSKQVAALYNGIGAAEMQLDNHERADRFLAEALRRQRRILGDVHTSVANTLGLIANLRGRQGRYKEAEPLQREALAIRERVLGADHPDLAISYDSLATTMDHLGRRDEARALYVQGLELRRRVLGERHPEVAGSLTNLSTFEYRIGDLESALERQLEAIAIYRESVGEIRNLAFAVGNAGVMLRDLGRYEEARPKLEESLAMRRRLMGEDNSAVATARMHLATLDRLTGRLAAAESQYREALAIFESGLPAGHTRIAEARIGLGAALVLRDRTAEALPLLEQAHEMLRASESVNDARLAECQLWLGAALARQSRPTEARILLDQASATLAGLRGPNDALSIQAASELAALER
jgi:eukaryotic-like serine/threonine-protein kinase